MGINAPAGGPEAHSAYLVPDAASGVFRYVMPEPDMPTLGEWIEINRQRLPKAHRARPQFAELAHISASTLEKIETGETDNPDTETVRKIAGGFAKALGRPFPISTLSSYLKWVPLEEVGSDWIFAGLDEEDRELLTQIVGRFRQPKAKESPGIAEVPRHARQQRAARS